LRLGTAPLAPLVPLIVTKAGGGDDGNSADDLQEGLQMMVLQPGDIPEGLQSLGGSFADNEQASSGLGGGPSKEQLDAWGRELGYQADYQATSPSSASFVTALSSAVSLYETDQGAADSFTDRVARARAADWQASHSELSDFMQEELSRDLGADDFFWLRLSGFQQTGPEETRLVTDDQIIFRVGRAWGYHNVISTGASGINDRQLLLPEVETPALTQISHMREGLDFGLLD
jgi:hypothetical protein